MLLITLCLLTQTAVYPVSELHYISTVAIKTALSGPQCIFPFISHLITSISAFDMVALP